MNSENEAYMLYCQGMERFEREDFTGALKLFRESLAIEPHFKTCELIYRCLKTTENDDEALKFLEKAYFLNSKNDKVAFTYADELYSKGEFDNSEKILNEILLRNSSYGPAKKLIGKILERR